VTSRWNNPTGGLAYHLQALSRRDTLWAPCVREIARFLAAWAPSEDSIVLVGPSGGHCLDPSFLGRFERVVAVDFDPFAPWVFRWRARNLLRSGRMRLTWDARDHLSPGRDGFDLGPLRALLDAHPGAAVLFCNILGQLPLLGEDRAADQDDDEQLERQIRAVLRRVADPGELDAERSGQPGGGARGGERRHSQALQRKPVPGRSRAAVTGRCEPEAERRAGEGGEADDCEHGQGERELVVPRG
jgi:hypothetical protein